MKTNASVPIRVHRMAQLWYRSRGSNKDILGIDRMSLDYSSKSCYSIIVSDVFMR